MANWITLARYPLLLACLAILYLGSPPARLAGAVLLFLGLLLDTVDGVVARARSETSLIGSVLDIAADRTYELSLWVSFAYLGLVPAVIPLVVLARTTITDALRSVGVAEGTAPLDQQAAPLARFVVASPWMRTGYSAAKVGAFCGLALAHAFLGYPAESGLRGLAPDLLTAANAVAWAAVVFCVVRGVPVIVEGVRRNRGQALRVP
ncbi:MAG TPA: CDP-alcohol phosphatidyltransferase family protein [Gemmatimonadales bacterium]|jgi:Phosphatidylglycerophosphate synthase